HQVHLGADADYAEDFTLSDLLSRVNITVNAFHTLPGDLHDIVGERLSLKSALHIGHQSFIVDYVSGILIKGRPFQQGPPMHGSHAKILHLGGVVPDKVDLPGKRGPVVVDVEGAHKDADEDLGRVQV